MTEANRFGLSRDIPEGIKREVRQRCGFGCVVCGGAFVQYDHLDPPFEEAAEHVASGIVLLCGGCHDRKTRRQLSVETVKRHGAAPAALAKGFSFGPLDIGSEEPEVQLGGMLCRSVDTLIEIHGQPVFTIARPEAWGAPYRVSTLIADKAGKEVLRIVDNEMRPTATNWDVEVIGPRLIIRGARRQIALVLRTDPPHRLVVERLQMSARGIQISIEEGQPLRFEGDSGRSLEVTDTEIFASVVGLQINASGCFFGVGGGMLKLGSIKQSGPPLPPLPLPPCGITHGLPLVLISSVYCWCGLPKSFADCCMPKVLRLPPYDY